MTQPTPEASERAIGNPPCQPPASADGAHPWPPLPDGKFDFIEADPNWRFKGWSPIKDPKNTRAPDRHYKTATLERIMALPVSEIAAKDSHLALWITGAMMTQGHHVDVMRAWGFSPSSIGWVWVKVNKKALQGRFFGPIDVTHFFMGLGKTTRQNAEFVILGRRGSPKRHDRGNHQILVEPRREHSRKPDEFYKRAAAYAGKDARKISLFSRQPREGWTVWGDETDMFEDAS